ncbi:MAG: BACON domain-containing protein, partial [Bacteroidales bacterium]|nr:BACON domain-containing protein [Bacteroidales bacterium]
MMRYFTQFFLLSLISIACCCQKPAGEDKDSAKTEAPTAITVSPESISASAEGSDYQLTVNSPVRPKLSGLPDWITMKDGVFNNYKIT